MTHEKLFLRQDGSKVKITAEYCTHLIGGGHYYSYYVEHMTPRQKDWQRIVPGDDYKPGLTDEERAAMWLAEELKYVTKEEIYQAKLELWQKLKPTEG